MGRETEVLLKAFGKTSTAVTATLVTVPATAGGIVIVAANSSRLYVILQNNAAEPCLLNLGGEPTISAYNYILAEPTGVRFGNGGALRIDNYQGEIKGLVESNTTVVSILEVTKKIT